MSQLHPHFLFFLVLLTLILATSQSPLANDYYNCSTTVACGNLVNVGFPFWGSGRGSSCGHPELELSCENGTTPMIVLNDVKYIVLGYFPPTSVLRVARADYSGGICPMEYLSTTLDPSLCEIVSGYSNYTLLYGCPHITNLSGQFSCTVNGVSNQDGYLILGSVPSGTCYGRVVVPLSNMMLSSSGNSVYGMEEALRAGFEVKLNIDTLECYECSTQNGVCGYDWSSNQTTCYCAGGCNSTTPAESPESHVSTRASGRSTSMSLGVVLGIGGAGIAVVLLGICGFLLLRRKRGEVGLRSTSRDSSNAPTNKLLHFSASRFSGNTLSFASSKSGLGKGNSTYFGVHVFDYGELEVATRNFDPSRELGDGGFGTVYHGELRDGRAVAVKRLYEHNVKRVEQFMNEIEILQRLDHPNLVRLYGCTSRRSQELLLVYEFIPNGTVADHIGRSRTSSGWLPWGTRLNIAIETADALAYLHESDIIHRDVKTNNILLDHDFRVKVADFGLSRLFPTDVTHVSTAPQGTPGYVDPEYYQCYQLTEKSDVYSFGVVLCELISSKPAVDTNRHRHDINLASMAMNRIRSQLLHELVDPCLGFDVDYTVRRAVRSVAELAFRCLQEDRDMRPGMVEVLEVLRVIKSDCTDNNNKRKAEVMGEAPDGQKGRDIVDTGASNQEVMDLRLEEMGLLRSTMPPPPLVPSPGSGSSSPKGINSV
ncbi:hypothetical protein MLD38_013317 [Melastoma candidum]|uniref:Uncharacterized protein n=1 Tax=Melastoma candidum TaxID=119954 RepID=A0ACB9R8K5_9MYRT|nr:hypothetical protein MLD38_013317 [Melastoma candidum]